MTSIILIFERSLENLDFSINIGFNTKKEIIIFEMSQVSEGKTQQKNFKNIFDYHTDKSF